MKEQCYTNSHQKVLNLTSKKITYELVYNKSNVKNEIAYPNIPNKEKKCLHFSTEHTVNSFHFVSVQLIKKVKDFSYRQRLEKLGLSNLL